MESASQSLSFVGHLPNAVIVGPGTQLPVSRAGISVEVEEPGMK